MFFKKIDKLNKWQSLLVLLGVLLAGILIVLIPFYIRGNYIVWVECAQDAVMQGVTYLEHVKAKGWLSCIGEFDYTLGLGADYLTSLSFFSLLDPFNILFFILPFNSLLSYCITMVAKWIFSGVCIWIYLKYKKVKNSSAIMLSLIYILTGFTSFTFVRHYNLTAGPIYFPLIILGLELTYNKKRPYLLVVAVCLCLMTNFYVFFSATILSIFYILVYHFVKVYKTKDNTAKYFIIKFLYVGGVFLLGIVLAGFMLLPNLYGYLNAARSASKGLPPINFKILLTNIATFFLPIQSDRYGHMYLNVVVIILAIYALLKREKNTKVYRIMVITLLVGFFIPLFGYTINIFNYCNNRWSYALTFFILVLIGKQSMLQEDTQEYEEKYITNIYRAIFAIIIFTLIVAVLFLGQLLKFGWHMVWIVAVIALIITGAVIFFKKFKTFNFLKKYFKQIILLPLASVLAVCSCIVHYSYYSKQHNAVPVYNSLFTQEEKFVAEQNKTEFFRTDSDFNTDWFKSYTNRPVNNGYMGTLQYNSISNKYVYEFFKENGVYNPTQNLGISGLNGRACLQNLLSVKYLHNTSGLYKDFTKVSGYENLYLNNNYNSFGIVYKDVYNKSDYINLDVLYRQYALMEAVVLENVKSTRTFTSVFNKEPLTDISVLTNGIDKQIQSVNGETVKGQELYLVVKGLGEVSSITKIEFTLNGITKEYRIAAKGDLMYSEQRDFYINFGECNSDSTNLKINITKGKAVNINSIEIQSIQGNLTSIATTTCSSLENMQNVEFANDRISGKVDTQDGGYLFLSIPYSDGWTAKVDGKKVEILKANTAFMAIKVDSGEHNILLEYKTPYLKHGIAVSIIGVAGLIGLVFVYEVLKKKKDK